LTELEDLVNNFEKKIPENMKELMSYTQNVNKKLNIKARLFRVVKYFEKA